MLIIWIRVRNQNIHNIKSFKEQMFLDGKSGVYTNVHDHMDWITPIISDEVNRWNKLTKYQ